MTTVYIDPYESFESAFRRFNKRVQDSRILVEVKERQEYKKPSKRRRDDQAACRSRVLKRQRKTQRSLEFQSMHKFPMRKKPFNNNQPNRPTNNHRPNPTPQQRPQPAPQQPRKDQPSVESLRSLQDKFGK